MDNYDEWIDCYRVGYMDDNGYTNTTVVNSIDKCYEMYKHAREKGYEKYFFVQKISNIVFID